MHTGAQDGTPGWARRGRSKQRPYEGVRMTRSVS